jgi:AraC-like DNA-binding protein
MVELYTLSFFLAMSETQLPLRETQQIGDQTREYLVTSQQLPLLTEYGMGMIGHSEAQEGFRFVRLRPSFAQVLVTLSGCGIVQVGNGWRELKPGMAYLMPAETLSAYHVPTGGHWTLLWVHINAGALRFPSPLATIVEQETQALQYSVGGLLHEALGYAEPEPLADWIRLTACEVRRLVCGTTRNTSRLSPLWAEVQANLAHSWTRDELAGRLGLSGERLRKLCQDSTGISPMAYVTRLRMQHAAALLASGRYSVTQVSLRVGYDNTLAFSTAFKRVMGMPPSSCLPRNL